MELQLKNLPNDQALVLLYSLGRVDKKGLPFSVVEKLLNKNQKILLSMQKNLKIFCLRGMENARNT
jgi:hypothetical protein